MKLTFKDLMKEYVEGRINFKTMILMYNNVDSRFLDTNSLEDTLYNNCNLEDFVYEIKKQKKKMYVHEYYFKDLDENYGDGFFVVNKSLTSLNWDDFKKAWVNIYLFKTEEIEVDCD